MIWNGKNEIIMWVLHINIHSKHTLALITDNNCTWNALSKLSMSANQTKSKQRSRLIEQHFAFAFKWYLSEPNLSFYLCVFYFSHQIIAPPTWWCCNIKLTKKTSELASVICTQKHQVSLSFHRLYQQQLCAPIMSNNNVQSRVLQNIYVKQRLDLEITLICP